MPYPRPTLSDLRAQVASDISSGLKTVDGLLRFSNMQITGKAVAGLAHLNYGYLDWIAKQATPYTSSGEYLEAWAALKKVFRKTASYASGAVTFAGTPGVVIDAGTEVARSDAVTFTVTAGASVGGGGMVTVAVTADEPGDAGNTAAGSLMTLGVSITGISSSGAVTTVITGGADQELDDSLFNRMLDAYQATANGGSKSDYVTWAEAIPGVTRAWSRPNGFGLGTVVLYVMLDDANAAHNGFPQGKDGISQKDNRVTAGSKAAGDQLNVADIIYDDQPTTAMLYVCSPLPSPTNFTIAGLTASSASVRAAISQAIAEVFLEQGDPALGNPLIALSDIESAIAAIATTQGFVITNPAGNIANTLGHLPTLGTITYT